MLKRTKFFLAIFLSFSLTFCSPIPLNSPEFVSETEVEDHTFQRFMADPEIIVQKEYIEVNTTLPSSASHAKINIAGDTYSTCDEQMLFPKTAVPSCDESLGSDNCEALVSICKADDDSCSEGARVAVKLEENVEASVDVSQSEALQTILKNDSANLERAKKIQAEACALANEVKPDDLDETLAFVANQAQTICEMDICSVLLSLDEFENQLASLLEQEGGSNDGKDGEDGEDGEDSLSAGIAAAAAAGAVAVAAGGTILAVELVRKHRRAKEAALRNDPELNELKEINKTLEDNLKASDTELEALKKQKAGLETELARVKAELASQVTANQELQVDNKALADKNTQLEADKAALEAKLADLEPKLEAAINENGKLKATTADLQKQLVELTDQRAAAIEDAEDAKRKLSEVEAKAEARHQAELEQLRKDAAELRKNLETSEKGNLELAQELETKAGELKQLNTDKQNLERDLLATNEAKKSAEKKAANLEASNTELQTKINETNAKALAADDQAKAATKVKEDALVELEKMKVQMEKQTKELKSARDQVENQVVRAKNLEGELEATKQKLAIANRRVFNLSIQLGLRDKVNADQATKIDSLTKELESLRDQNEASLTNQQKESARKLKEAEDAKNKAEAEKVELQKQLKFANEASSKAKADATKANAEANLAVDSANQNATEANAKAKEANKVKEIAEAKVTELNGKLAVTSLLIASQKNKIKNLTETVDTQKTEIANLKEINAGLQLQVQTAERAEAKIEELERKLAIADKISAGYVLSKTMAKEYNSLFKNPKVKAGEKLNSKQLQDLLKKSIKFKKNNDRVVLELAAKKRGLKEANNKLALFRKNRVLAEFNNQRFSGRGNLIDASKVAQEVTELKNNLLNQNIKLTGNAFGTMSRLSQFGRLTSDNPKLSEALMRFLNNLTQAGIDTLKANKQSADARLRLY